jgi:pimeloyl-ACP methyl ester carboxylesterase
MIRRRALLAAAALVPPGLARAQGYYDRGMFERAVRFAGSGGATLDGTLTLPRRSEIQYVPGVVLIAGSGPTDRDGNNPYVPERIDLLREVAALLADSGIAALRYDKRGIGASSRPPAAPNESVLEVQERFFAWDNFVGDVRAAHAELLRHDEIKKHATGLVGHSEGGLLAIAAAVAMGTGRPHALVLLSTPGRKLGEIVRAQLRRNAPSFAAEAERTMAAIEASGRMPEGISRELQPLFPPYGGAFFKGALDFDPAAALARLDNPCLLLHGAEDRQVVPMADIQPLLDVLARRGASGEALIGQAASHNLKPVATPFDAGFSGPLSPAIAHKLASWLATVLGA